MNSVKMKECSELSSEILRNFELSEIPVSRIILKCLRLCRLLGDEDGILLFTFELSGYTNKEDNIMSSESWRISKMAGRRYFKKEKDEIKENEYAELRTIAELEEIIESQKIRLSAAADPDISLSSANPSQAVFAPPGNKQERSALVSSIISAQKLLQTITGNLYAYILQIYNRLTYGNIVDDTFLKSRMSVNEKLVDLCPKSIEKFISVYDNMDSDNPEDWANAVHSCRRILLDLADALYPPREDIIGKNGKPIKLGRDQYINRLVQFISEKEGSETYAEIVGTDLKSIGERIDAIYNASNKGTHSEIKKDEAARYIIHTYLLISDIIALNNPE